MKAVIFDMNGVIIEDERFHQKSWRVLCQTDSSFRTPTEEQFKHNVFGRTERDTLECLLERSITPQELEAYSDKRVSIVKQLFDPLVLTEGLGDFLENLDSNMIPVGIATSSRRNYVNHILDGLDIRRYFHAVVTAEDIKKGKPDPEIYLQASNRLGIKPQDCLVFEDTISGIKAAKSAGMSVIAIATTHELQELFSADTVINTFKELRIDNNSLSSERGYKLPIESLTFKSSPERL